MSDLCGVGGSYQVLDSQPDSLNCMLKRKKREAEGGRRREEEGGGGRRREGEEERGGGRGRGKAELIW